MKRSQLVSAISAIAVSGTLVLAPITVPSAAAAEVAFDAGPYFENNERFHGATSPDVRRIEVGPATTTVVVAPAFTVRWPGISCRGVSGRIPGLALEAGEWGGSLAMPIEAGTFDASGDTDSYLCHTGETGENEVDSTTWTLVESADAPSTVVLDHDPSTLVSRIDEYAFLGERTAEPRRIDAGDRVTVTGVAGRWPTAGPTTVDLLYRGTETAAEEVSVAADGNSFSFTLPADLPDSELSSAYIMSAAAESLTPGTATTPEVLTRATWGERVAVHSAETSASTTHLSLNRHYAFTFSRVTATVTARTSDGAATGGWVLLQVDGRTVATKSVAVGDDVRVTFTLPMLSRGLHTVSAVYEGTPTIEGSRSGTERVRILL